MVKDKVLTFIVVMICLVVSLVVIVGIILMFDRETTIMAGVAMAVLGITSLVLKKLNSNL